MSWEALFQAGNALALAAWALLVFGPRGALAGALVMYGGVGLLCLGYTGALGLVLGGLVDPLAPAGAEAAGFTTMAGVRALFASQAGLAMGWLHYLALDLFAGLWIARDADAKRFSRLAQAPVLLATLLSGPAGLLAWLLLRERAARLSARRAGKRGDA